MWVLCLSGAQDCSPIAFTPAFQIFDAVSLRLRHPPRLLTHESTLKTNLPKCKQGNVYADSFQLLKSINTTDENSKGLFVKLFKTN